jgi:hypothetical protein
MGFRQFEEIEQDIIGIFKIGSIRRTMHGYY